MSNELILLLCGIMFLASLVAAYNMGWQNGHDIHHDDSEHGPSTPPPTDTALWR